jgi:hypothetical protein
MSAVALVIIEESGVPLTTERPGLTADDLENLLIIGISIGSYLIALAALWSYEPFPRSITIYMMDPIPNQADLMLVV